jgi:phospholipid/cholesterol/gamma-HCH transport system permease protein
MNRKTTIFQRVEHGTGAKVVESFGRSAMQRASVGGRAVLLFLDSIHQLPQTGRVMPQLFRQIEICGIGSIFVLALIAFLTGMIMALQTGSELAKFGAQANLGAIIGATFVREFGPIWAAIIMLSRVGAAMAAELGTMAVNEEIDALRVMNINPVRFLVLPRMLALIIAMPLLTVIADYVGMFGGGLVAAQVFNRPPEEFLESARGILGNVDFYSGLVKSMVFGALIATIACDRGLHTIDGAEGVGRSTNQTVVSAVVCVLIANLIMTGFVQQILKPVVE